MLTSYAKIWIRSMELKDEDRALILTAQHCKGGRIRSMELKVYSGVSRGFKGSSWNPFNGIERNIVVTTPNITFILRESVQWNWKSTDLASFTILASIRWESVQWNWKKPLNPNITPNHPIHPTNPFNGIERQAADVVRSAYEVCLRNPFNGIERSTSRASPQQ